MITKGTRSLKDVNNPFVGHNLITSMIITCTIEGYGEWREKPREGDDYKRSICSAFNKRRGCSYIEG